MLWTELEIILFLVFKTQNFSQNLLFHNMAYLIKLNQNLLSMQLSQLQLTRAELEETEWTTYTRHFEMPSNLRSLSNFYAFVLQFSEVFVQLKY